MTRWRSTSASSDDVRNLRHRQRFWTGDVIHARLIGRRQSCPQKRVDGILEEEPLPTSWGSRMLGLLDAANHPHRALVVAGCAVFGVTLLGGVFMYLKGRWSAFAAESIFAAVPKRVMPRFTMGRCHNCGQELIEPTTKADK